MLLLFTRVRLRLTLCCNRLLIMFPGFLPKVLRLAPGGGVLLLVVEFTLGVFRKALGPPYI